jgi:hypothetical protein
MRRAADLAGLQLAMERGGPTLCSIHATETVALDDSRARRARGLTAQDIVNTTLPNFPPPRKRS